MRQDWNQGKTEHYRETEAYHGKSCHARVFTGMWGVHEKQARQRTQRIRSCMMVMTGNGSVSELLSTRIWNT